MKPAEPSLDVPVLSVRQQQVLVCVASGQTNKEVADTLQLSTRTVEHHLSAIYARLAVSNRVQALRRGRACGLLPRD